METLTGIQCCQPPQLADCRSFVFGVWKEEQVTSAVCLKTGKKRLMFRRNRRIGWTQNSSNFWETQTGKWSCGRGSESFNFCVGQGRNRLWFWWIMAPDRLMCRRMLSMVIESNGILVGCPFRVLHRNGARFHSEGAK